MKPGVGSGNEQADEYGVSCTLAEQASILAARLKALSHPARVEIVRQLAMRENCCGGDFCACLPLAQSTISQHLEMLRKAGIVEWRQQGTRSLYTLNRSALDELARQVRDLAGSG